MGTLQGWRFCPRCGAGLEIDEGRARCPACAFVGYANSDPTVCALCVDDQGRLLLCRRAVEPDRGKWDLPGGFLAEGEHPLDALRRELREETGLDVEPLEFVGAWVDRYGDVDDAPATLNLYWTVRVTGGEPEPADDVAELRWFHADELPPASEVAFRTVIEVLHAWRGSAAA
jgi:ADP-ribose pyrophosphatase YjhB (NUDIX family)